MIRIQFFCPFYRDSSMYAIVSITAFIFLLISSVALGMVINETSPFKEEDRQLWIPLSSVIIIMSSLILFIFSVEIEYVRRQPMITYYDDITKDGYGTTIYSNTYPRLLL